MLKPTDSDIRREVLRVFDVKEYALEFLRGNLRLKERYRYRQCEEARRDEGEGEARLRELGVNNELVKVSGELMNPVYVLCTSLLTVERKVRERFGCHVVHVRDTARLFAALKDLVGTSPLPGRDVISVDAGLVVYNRDELIAETLDDEWRTRLTYLQKSQVFSKECEYRFAVQMSGPLFAVGMSRLVPIVPECLHLEVGSMEEFADLLPPEAI